MRAAAGRGCACSLQAEHRLQGTHRRVVRRCQGRGGLAAQLAVRKGGPALQVLWRLELEQQAGGLAVGATLGCMRSEGEKRHRRRQ